MGKALSYENHRLVFEDDFDGTELDRSCWNVELHPPGWVNEELQAYVDNGETVRVEEGKLLLRAVKKVDGDGRVSYTSGRVSTRWKRDFTYGIFEARLKVPQGKGFLPAFWLMTTDEERYGQWPVCGEIDIMEVLGNRTKKNHGTLHYGLPHEQVQGTVTLEEGDFFQEFHDFAVKWEPGLIRWYLDGVEYFCAGDWFSTGSDGVKKPFPAPFDHDMYLILNLAVGGSWVGNPDGTTDFQNAVFAVDRVRVFQNINGGEPHGQHSILG